MGTLTFTLKTFDSETPIKNSILQKIEDFKNEKTQTEKAVSKRVNELFDIRKKIMESLFKDLGADVWFIRDENTYHPRFNRLHKSSTTQIAFGVTIGFRDGVYKNTPYNDWDLYIQTPWKSERKLNDLSFRVPDLDTFELYLVKSDHNNSRRNELNQISHLITDINQIHEFMESDYTQFFINQEKKK